MEKTEIYGEKEAHGPLGTINIEVSEWKNISESTNNIIVPLILNEEHKIILYINKINKEIFMFEPLKHMEGDKELMDYLTGIRNKYFPNFTISNMLSCVIEKRFQDFESKITKDSVLCLVFSFFYMFLILLNPGQKSNDLLRYFILLKKEYMNIFKIFFFWTYEKMYENFMQNKSDMITNNKVILEKIIMEIPNMDIKNEGEISAIEKKDYMINIIKILLFNFGNENPHLIFIFNFYPKLIQNKMKFFIDNCAYTISLFYSLTIKIKNELNNIGNNDAEEIKRFYYNFIAKFNIFYIESKKKIYTISFLSKIIKFKKRYDFTIPSYFILLPYVRENIHPNEYVKIFKIINSFIDNEKEKEYFIYFLSGIFDLYRTPINPESIQIKQTDKIVYYIKNIKDIKLREKIIHSLKEVENNDEYKDIRKYIEICIKKLILN